ncbi:hypothetical protein [Cryobacterium sp. MLB-32]|uniref:hypothetical protein n=1 Tax=Cryobacterium sp. MLB-32 TaxID=1529318 RepID=UPI00350EC59C
MTWQLRRATVADLEAIMALETSIFENDAWSSEMMARDVADPACYYLVAFPPDRPDRIEPTPGCSRRVARRRAISRPSASPSRLAAEGSVAPSCSP